MKARGKQALLCCLCSLVGVSLRAAGEAVSPAPALPPGVLLYASGEATNSCVDAQGAVPVLRWSNHAGYRGVPVPIVENGWRGKAFEFGTTNDPSLGSEIVLPLEGHWRGAAGTVEFRVFFPQLPADMPILGAYPWSVPLLTVGHYVAPPIFACTFQQKRVPDKDAQGKETGTQHAEQRLNDLPLKTPLVAGRWYHIAWTWNSVTDRVYVDGQFVGSRQQGRRLLEPLRPDLVPLTLAIGTKRFPPAGVRLDELYVYAWPLSDAEVAQAAARAEAGRLIPLPESCRFALHDDMWGPGEQAVLARVDTFNHPQRDAIKQVHVELLDARDKAIASETLRFLHEGLEQKLVRAQALPPGDYRLRATARDAGGKTLATAVTPPHTIKAYPWLFNHLGETDALPEPWTPVQARGNRVDVWGREHTLARSGLPTEVVTAGRQVLAGPVALRWQRGSASGTLEGGTLKVRRLGDTRAEWTAAGSRLGEAGASASGWIEYDGVMAITLTINAGATPLDLDALTLEVALKPEHSKLIHSVGWNCFWWHTTRRLLSPRPGEVFASNEYRNPAEPDWFTPYVWIGDDDRGLTWFAESPRNWRTGNKHLTTVERRTDGTAVLRIPFIDTPATLAEPTEYRFGFVATPVKPLPPRWRAFNIGLTYTLDKRLVEYAGRENYKWIWPNPGFPQQDFSRSFAVGPEDPTGDKWAAYWGEKFATEVPKPGTWGGPGYPVPYTDLHIVQSDVWPDYADFMDECGGYDHWTMGASQGFEDYFLWRFAKPWVERQMVGGIYIDEPYGHGTGWTTSPFLGAWFDERGLLHPAWTLLRERQLLKRILMVQRQKGLPGMIWLHMTANWYPHAHTHVTAIMDGEIGSGLTSTNEDVIGYWIGGWLRACDRGQPTGLIPLNMNSNIRADSPLLWRPWVGLCWTHDILPIQGIDNKYIGASLLARLDFDIANPDVQFVGYWDNRVATVKLASGAAAPEPAADLSEAVYGPTDEKGRRDHPEKARDNPHRVFVSLYRRPDKALITALNYNDGEARGELVLDPARWSFVKDWQVTDAESGQPVAGATRAAIPFAIPYRDFRMFWVGPRPTAGKER